MKTGHKPSAPSCNLGRLQAKSMDVEGIKEEAWNDHKILVVRADDERIGWIERQLIEQLGQRLYGRRDGQRVRT
jgi:hypothetical protein